MKTTKKGLEDHLVIIIGGSIKGLVSHHPRQAINLGANDIVVTNTNGDSATLVREHITQNVENPTQTSWNHFNMKDRYHSAIVRNEDDLSELFSVLKDSDRFGKYFEDDKILTIIAGKDPVRGDNIHATYSQVVAKTGSMILCEKPFTRDQDEFHLGLLTQLPEDKFSSNQQIKYLRQSVPQHHQSEPVRRVIWSTNGASESIVGDLLPHIFSVIDPKTLSDLKIQRYIKVGNEHLFYGQSSEGSIEIQIDSNDTGIRGFQIGNTTYLSHRTHLIQFSETDIDYALQSEPTGDPIDCGDMLQKSILDLTRGTPSSPPSKTLESELFIKKLKESMK